MNVTVIFLGILKDKAGLEKLDVDLPNGATFGDLMREIGSRFGDKFPETAWDREANAFKPPIMTVGDGRDLESPDTPLMQGEKIKIVAPLAGG
jgi:molybdopterin converting factor small subunit